jgi:hypothetical protein
MVARNTILALPWVEVMDEREATLQWLAGLTDKAFAEFFYKAVRSRKTDARGHFVLADADVSAGRWHVDYVAQPAVEHYDGPWVDDALICQWGQCDSCGSPTRSWAKHAICPVCGSKVYCS